MFNLFKKPTPKNQPCNIFIGTVKDEIKGDFHHLIGKCINCNQDFADHSFITNACPMCGEIQKRERGSIQQPSGKKYKVIKFEACKCLSRNKANSTSNSSTKLIKPKSTEPTKSNSTEPIYMSPKPVRCKCGKFISYSENSVKNSVFCGDHKCFMKYYYVPPPNVDLSGNGVELPPLSFTSLSKTKFCACKNICEYDMEHNVYKDKCWRCNLTD